MAYLMAFTRTAVALAELVEVKRRNRIDDYEGIIRALIEEALAALTEERREERRADYMDVVARTKLIVQDKHRKAFYPPLKGRKKHAYFNYFR